MTQIIVIDLGTGNLRSVAKAAEHVGGKSCHVEIYRQVTKITQADKVILPGQGAIGTWLSALSDSQLKTSITDALDNKPVLGICVGMQALFDYNEEDGGHQCLGLFRGKVSKFDVDQQGPDSLPMKVPQMGWNQVNITQTHPLWNNIDDKSWFYFLHSYYAIAEDDRQVFGETEYGLNYTCAVAQDNVFAIQCHPEKSHHVGLKLFENFINWKI